MVVRGAEYKRKKNDFYPTPAETARVLLYLLPFKMQICDPCSGKGVLLDVIRELGKKAGGGDISRGYDFLKHKFKWHGYDIVTNPPYGPKGKTAEAFIDRALELTEPYQGSVAMLLPVDFDSAGTRSRLFGACPLFTTKVVLTNRIRFFNGVSGSTNHAWFVWRHTNTNKPIILYRKQQYGEGWEYDEP